MYKKHGFTLVELLVVVVVIAVLAGLAILGYSGIQKRASDARIKADLTNLQHAIVLARTHRDDLALRYITNSTYTAGGCSSVAAGTDLTTLSPAHTCWTNYVSALDTISTASGIDVRGLKDPWGRPYRIDENERDDTSACGSNKDNLSVFARPYVNAGTATDYVYVPYVTPGC